MNINENGIKFLYKQIVYPGHIILFGAVYDSEVAV